MTESENVTVDVGEGGGGGRRSAASVTEEGLEEEGEEEDNCRSRFGADSTPWKEALCLGEGVLKNPVESVKGAVNWAL